ncbi:MAG: hypothetical protein AAFQ43_06565 [Bacteroidota bacterium]
MREEQSLRASGARGSSHARASGAGAACPVSRNTGPATGPEGVLSSFCPMPFPPEALLPEARE